MKRLVDKEKTNIFQRGSIKEINDLLFENHEEHPSTFNEGDIEELFSIFDYDKINQESYEQIERLLFNLMCFGYEYSEIYKLIIDKALENVENQRYLLEYIIEDGSLSLISKEQLESLQIKELYLDNSNLRNLPEKLGHLNSLEELVINCKFQTLPKSLNRLPNLKSLSIVFQPNDYDYLELPNVIESLTSLEAIDISYFNTNGLALYHVKFPISFKKLTSLKSLRLTSNKLWKIPKEVTTLTRLEELDFSFNNLKELPPTLKNLTNLKILNIELNSFEKFPEVITSLNSLKELYIGGNNFPKIPESIGKLKSLEILKFAPGWVKYGNLEKLPSSIGNLIFLRELDISFNRLKELPESIGNLKTLEKLRLAFNPIDKLPDSFMNLSALKTLDIAQTQINRFPLKENRLDSLETIRVKRDYKNDLDGLQNLINHFKNKKNKVVVNIY